MSRRKIAYRNLFLCLAALMGGFVLDGVVFGLCKPSANDREQFDDNSSNHYARRCLDVLWCVKDNEVNDGCSGHQTEKNSFSKLDDLAWHGYSLPRLVLR